MLFDDGITSMEPCLFRHGKDPRPDRNGGLRLRLQWSHVFSDMVSTEDISELVELLTLQWSHVFSDMVRYR